MRCRTGKLLAYPIPHGHRQRRQNPFFHAAYAQERPVLGPPVWASQCQPAIPQAQPGSLFDNSPQKQPQKASVPLPPVGLVTHGQIQPGFLVYNASLVGEGRKPGLPMIGAHAAFAYAPKAHFAGGQVDDHVIDAPAANCRRPRASRTRARSWEKR